MKINEKRLLANLNALKGFTDTPGNGVSRFSFSKQDAIAREYIIKRALDAGCSVNIDALQNVRIGLPTNIDDRKTVICGSHVDTVRNGGWLDGIYGVCGALEVLECLANDDDIDSGNFKYNYEMVIFSEEEGSNFGSTMTGSKFVTGIYKEADLDKLVNDEGKTLRQTLISLPISNESDSWLGSDNDGDVVINVYSDCAFEQDKILWDFDKIKSMLELHIEQGPVLHSENLSIGIVEAIFGMRVIEVSLKGVGNHAGATPMHARYDALCTAAECITATESYVKSDDDKRTVVTIGKLELSPNCSNVIPESVKFTVEVRDKDESKIDGFMDGIIEIIHEISAKRGVSASVREHSKSSPLVLSPRLRDDMQNRAMRCNLAYKVMDSGAVHDACMIANFAPTGMIFVPSIDGRSHVPEENTNDEDLIAGVQFLMDTVLHEIITEVN